MKTIDLTPTWQDLLPVFFDMIRNQPVHSEAYKTACEEITRIAKAVDAMNAKNKEATSHDNTKH